VTEVYRGGEPHGPGDEQHRVGRRVGGGHHVERIHRRSERIERADPHRCEHVGEQVTHHAEQPDRPRDHPVQHRRPGSKQPTDDREQATGSQGHPEGVGDTPVGKPGDVDVDVGEERDGTQRAETGH